MYCTVADIIEDMSERKVAETSNDAAPTVVDAARVTTFIIRASEIIDAHLRGRYPVPHPATGTGSELLRDVCITLVRVKLLRRRSQASEFDEKQYSDALAVLTKLQRGEMLIETGMVAGGTAGGVADRPRFVRGSCREQVFTDAMLSSY
jgi:phage gp36-like protein